MVPTVSLCDLVQGYSLGSEAVSRSIPVCVYEFVHMIELVFGLDASARLVASRPGQGYIEDRSPS
jgi:hypothetical protein